MDSSTYRNIVHLLEGVKRTHAHNEEIEKLRGEKFNIFSILGLERNENKTHSAFIAELLNPQGTHLKGAIFLDHFLTMVGIEDFDTDKVKITQEKHIGRIDHEHTLGGRVDIEIDNGNGKPICIENKIYARDQPDQIARYCAYNQGTNTVLYLTLDGREPDHTSSGHLKSGEHFICISYRETILGWLQECVSLSAEDPILRESIRQYIILIKKLTGQLNDKRMEKDLENLLLANPKAAELIHQNFPKILNKIKSDFRELVIQELGEILPDDFVIERGNDVSKNNSQLWIKPQSNGKNWWPCYGIETFSGHGNFEGQLICGIICNKTNFDDLPKSLQHYDHRGWWMQYIAIKTPDGTDLDFADTEFITKLGSDHRYRDVLVAEIIKVFTAFFEETKDEFLRAFKWL